MATAASANGWVAAPINTYTGGYEYMVQDLSVPTSMGALAFIRDYASLTTANPTTLSPGWTHNHDIRLIMPDDPDGQEGVILFKAHSANQYSFQIIDETNGIYSSAPGLCASLVREPGHPVHFVVTDSSQHNYTFDEDGILQSYADAQGHAWTYEYTSGKLDRIEADGGLEYLDLEYEDGKLHSVWIKLIEPLFMITILRQVIWIA